MHSSCIVERPSESFVKHIAEVTLTLNIAVDRGHLEPASRLPTVLANARSFTIAEAHIVLGCCMSLARRAPVPAKRGADIAVNSQAIVETHAQVELSTCVPYAGRILPKRPNSGPWRRPWASAAISEPVPESKQSIGIAPC